MCKLRRLSVTYAANSLQNGSPISPISPDYFLVMSRATHVQLSDLYVYIYASLSLSLSLSLSGYLT